MNQKNMLKYVNELEVYNCCNSVSLLFFDCLQHQFLMLMVDDPDILIFSGLLNRLSESNVESIAGEISTIFHVTY